MIFPAFVGYIGTWYSTFLVLLLCTFPLCVYNSVDMLSVTSDVLYNYSFGVNLA